MNLVRLLKHSLVCLTAFVSVLGCAGAEVESFEQPIHRELSARIEEYTSPSFLAMANGKRVLRLGESPEKALSLFPRPSRGFPIDDQVPGFPEVLKSKGWESSQEGFGIITRDDEVLLAMHQLESLDADQFAILLAELQAAVPDAKFELTKRGTTETWWTAYSEDVLMISRTPNKKKRYQVTVTLGHQLLAEALGLDKYMVADTQAPTSSVPIPGKASGGPAEATNL